MNPGAAPSNEVLVERLNQFAAQLEIHRVEARKASEESREEIREMSSKLDALLELRSRVEATAEVARELHETVNGEKGDPGLKGRLDRAERSIAMGVWVASAIALATIALVFEWAKRKLGVSP